MDCIPGSLAIQPAAHAPRDLQGEQLLEKHRMLIDGLRGERVVRRNATYEVDPVTRRINR